MCGELFTTSPPYIWTPFIIYVLIIYPDIRDDSKQMHSTRHRAELSMNYFESVTLDLGNACDI